MTAIRRVRPDEVEKLQELNAEIFVENPQYDPDLVLNWGLSEEGKKYFTTIINDPQELVLVAEDDNKLVGYISASPKTITYRKSKYIEIDNVGVIPAYRYKGIAKMLMEQCLAWAKKQGYQKAYLSCYFKNTNAIAFYKNNGFSEIDINLEKEI